MTGPRTCAQAIVAAADPALASQGVVVAHGRRDPCRRRRPEDAHACDFDTFQSPNAGRLGRVTDAGVTSRALARAPSACRACPRQLPFRCRC